MAVVNLIKEHQIVFIHIPKTAGSSIRRGYFKNNFEKFVGFKFPNEWDNLFKFTFVRNPYDRFISAYKMFTEGFVENKPHINLNYKTKMSPKEFLMVAKKDTNYLNTSGIGFHVYPQTHEFNFLKHSDFVGRFETIEYDFKEICNINNIEYTTLPHWNRTNRLEYREYYDDELLEMVSDYYSEDLKVLNYKF